MVGLIDIVTIGNPWILTRLTDTLLIFTQTLTGRYSHRAKRRLHQSFANLIRRIDIDLVMVVSWYPGSFANVTSELLQHAFTTIYPRTLRIELLFPKYHGCKVSLIYVDEITNLTKLMTIYTSTINNILS